jgi:ribonuclease HI
LSASPRRTPARSPDGDSQTSPPVRFRANVDGASRGNPGHAGIGVNIDVEGAGTVYQRALYLGTTTNNQAEYRALLHCLGVLEELGLDQGVVLSDSELLVKHLSGEYRVKDAELRPLYEQARGRLDQTPGIEVRHVRRKENAAADRLANSGIDWGRKVLGEKTG